MRRQFAEAEAGRHETIEWIHVEDRLPLPRQMKPYLMRHHDGSVMELYYRLDATCHMPGHESVVCTIEDITHWAEMPKGPQ
jgi:hypothetical protein